MDIMKNWILMESHCLYNHCQCHWNDKTEWQTTTKSGKVWINIFLCRIKMLTRRHLNKRLQADNQSSKGKHKNSYISLIEQEINNTWRMIQNNYNVAHSVSRLSTYVRVREYVHMHICMCVSVSMCNCICVCVGWGCGWGCVGVSVSVSLFRDKAV